MASDADVDFTIKSGDTLPLIEATLTYADGTSPNLTGASVLFLMRTENLATSKVSAAARIVNSTAPAKVDYSWTSANTAVTVDTDFLAEWEVTFADGKVRTFPTLEYHVVRVKASLGGV